MKKVLLTSTAMVLTAGYAAADVTVGGDGRLGVIDNFDRVYIDTGSTANVGVAKDQVGFTSRIRISFSASGETDGGLSFGGSIRADNAPAITITDAFGNNVGDTGFVASTATIGGGGVLGQAGSVFIEGSWGKLSFGDTNSGAEVAVGDISGVGLTGLSDLNETTYIGSGGTDPTALYEYTMGAWGVYFSATNPNNNTLGITAGTPTAAIGFDYNFGNWTIGVGYEDAGTSNGSHIVGGLTATYGGFTGKLIGGQARNIFATNRTQWGISGDYTFGANTVTAFYRQSFAATNRGRYGIGYAYDLGGGASLVAGYAYNEGALKYNAGGAVWAPTATPTATNPNIRTGATVGDGAFDFGVKFSF